MIAEQLKKSILQAAIQGKLTQQRPEDGDARDLLKEIKKEKNRLFNEDKIGKEIPFPEITENEIPFEIPENWGWSRVGTVFTLQAGKFVASNSIRTEGKYPCYGGNGLRGYVDTFNRIGRFPLIGRQGALCGNINIAEGKFHATEHAVVVETYCSCNPDWAAYFLRALDLNQYSTATAQPGLAVSKINQVPFPVPPIAEQNRIVEQIEKLLPEIEALKADECRLDVLQRAFPKKMKASVLQFAVEGKLTEQLASDGDAHDLLKEIQKEKARLVKEGRIRKEKPLPEITEDEIPFDIPQNWSWARLNDLAFLEDGIKLSGHNFIILEAKYLRGKISGERTAAGKFVNKGERVILVDGENSGEVFIVPHDGYMGSTFKILRVIREDLWFFLEFFLKKQQELLKNNKRGAAIPHLDKKLFREMLVPLPPINEQKRIVERLNNLLPLCNSLSPEALAIGTTEKFAADFTANPSG